MRNILKNIGLASIMFGLACFVVSCDEEETASFDYQYDGLTSVPTVEIDLETAKKIQRTGTIEDVTIAKAPLPAAVPTPEATEKAGDMGMEMNTGNDPNSF